MHTGCMVVAFSIPAFCIVGIIGREVPTAYTWDVWFAALPPTGGLRQSVKGVRSGASTSLAERPLHLLESAV